MNSHILSLLVWISSLTGYSIPPDAHLQVTELTRNEMAHQICHLNADQLKSLDDQQTQSDGEYATPKRTCPIIGLYMDNDILYIRNDVDEDLQESVLVHELTHWLQHHSGKFSLTSCLDTYAREMEAFRVQNVYIRTVQNKFEMYSPPMNRCPAEK